MQKKTLLNLLQLLLLSAVVTLTYNYNGGWAALKASAFTVLMLMVFFDEAQTGIAQRLGRTLLAGVPILALYFLLTPDILAVLALVMGGFFLLGAAGGLYEAYVHQRGSGAQTVIMTQYMPVMLLSAALLLWLGLRG